MNSLQVIFLALLGFVTILLIQLTLNVFKWAKLRDGGPSPSFFRLMNGRGETGLSNSNWAFYLHRLSGIGIALFLPLHILDIAVFAYLPEKFDQLHAIYGTPLMRVFECGLLFALLFHALNGLRIIAVDFFDWSTNTSARILRVQTWIVLGVTAWGSLLILEPIFK